MPRASATTPRFSISIVSHGHAVELIQLLEGLRRFERADQIQLIISDNLGNDLPDTPAAGWHSVSTLRPAHPRGFAANHNAAFEHAAGTFFCVLNPDVVFQQSVLQGLAERLDRGEAHIAAPIMRDSAGSIQDSFRRLPTPISIVRRRLGHDRSRPQTAMREPIQPDWIAGTFMLMQASTFRSLGGFDPRFRLYFEDVELCARARLQGMEILVDPLLHVQHDPRHASRRGGRHLLWHVQSALRFFGSDVYRRARRYRRA